MKSEIRKTHTILTYEWKKIYNEKIKLDNTIRERLFFLTTKFPDANLGVLADGTPIKAKSIDNKNYISTLEITDCLNYISIIENWIEEKHKIKQLRLF